MAVWKLRKFFILIESLISLIQQQTMNKESIFFVGLKELFVVEFKSHRTYVGAGIFFATMGNPLYLIPTRGLINEFKYNHRVWGGGSYVHNHTPFFAL